MRLLLLLVEYLVGSATVHWGDFKVRGLVGSRKLDPGAAGIGLREATDDAVAQPPALPALRPVGLSHG